MVKLADGSFTPIVGFSIVWLTIAFYLSNVLHVPKLSCNLLSISKVTANQNCIVNFSPHFVFFRTNYWVSQLGVLRLFPDSTILCVVFHLMNVVMWLLVLNSLLVVIRSCSFITVLVIQVFLICVVYVQIMTRLHVKFVC